MNNISERKALRNLIRNNGILLPLFLVVQITIRLTSVHMYIRDAFAIVVLLLLCGCYKRVKNALFLLLFSVVNFAFLYFGGESRSNFESLGYLICPVAYYLFGYSVVAKSKSDEEIPIFIVMMIVASSIVLWINTIVDISSNGLINVTREIHNADGIMDTSATLYGLIAAIGISGIAYVLSFGPKVKSLFVLSILAFSLSLLSTIHLVNRTGLFVVALSIIATLAYTFKKGNKAFLPILIILAAVFILLKENTAFFSDAVKAYQDREYNESVTTGNGRFKLWAESFHYMFKYPFGWDYNEIGYVHNLWLDVARTSGIFSFLLLVVFSLRSYRITFKLYKKKGNPINGMLVGVNVCLFASAFVEPVLDGVSTYFYVMCLIWGIQVAYCQRFNQ